MRTFTFTVDGSEVSIELSGADAAADGFTARTIIRVSAVSGGWAQVACPEARGGRRGRKLETPLSSIPNGRNAWLEGAPLTQQRKREEKASPYRKSPVRRIERLSAKYLA